MTAIQELLIDAIDYAGLFPPASLSMNETVANYASYLADPPRGMLGRLVVPTAKFNELKQAVESLQTESLSSASSPWRISALVPASPENEYDDFHQALGKISEFNRLSSKDVKQSLLVDSIEVKVNSAAELSHLAESCQPDLDCYFEIDCLSDPTAMIEMLARVRASNAPQNGKSEVANGSKRLFGKIRTGSVIASQIPSIEQVSRFVALCARDMVPFKATAGLHHPIRNEYRLTYEPDSDCGTMHGFLNMFIATLFAYEYQLNEKEIAKILLDREANNFHFENDRIQWHHLTVGIERIETLRSQSIQSFGSCSFSEPTTELCELYQRQFS